MGVSTNAILAFGFDLGDLDNNLPEGLARMFDEYDNDEEAVLLDLYSTDTTPVEDINKVPVDLIRHCSRDNPMYFLAVRGTKQVALRGYPTAAVFGHVHDSEVKALRDFCTRHNIPWQEPKWCIFSYWG
jgi:hypothetical protein